MSRTRLSARGTIELPKALRQAHGYVAGTEFEVIDGDKQIVLRPIHQEAEMGDAAWQTFLSRRIRVSKPVDITEEDFRAAIDAEAIRDWDEENRD